MQASAKRTALFALPLVLGAVLAAPAQAQVAAYVNGEPISASEVEQRMRINRIARQPATSRAAALKELVDDRIKLNEARRIGYRITDEHMDEQIQRIAKSNNQTLPEFYQNLSKSGVDSTAYRQKLKAGYAWDLIVEKRQKGTQGTSFETIFQNSSTSGSGRVIDYTLYSVIFVVPRGASPGSRMAEANGARARFNDCSSGLAMLRGMRDVAVKSPVRRSSDGLSPQLNKLLEATPVNRMSQAFPSPQGIEAVAVCEKVARAGRGGAAGGGDDVKAKTTDAAKYLQELRSRSVVQYR
jgi:peptidyl-prolyl cis-trans isomerase SurA